MSELNSTSQEEPKGDLYFPIIGAVVYNPRQSSTRGRPGPHNVSGRIGGAINELISRPVFKVAEKEVDLKIRRDCLETISGSFFDRASLLEVTPRNNVYGAVEVAVVDAVRSTLNTWDWKLKPTE